MPDTLLGKRTRYPDRYARDVLRAIARAGNREVLGIRASLPFHGKDIWNAYELTWLEPSGKPVVAVATIEVDAASLAIVESKSLKLYLNSLAMERYESSRDVAALIQRDLAKTVLGDVFVTLATPSSVADAGIRDLPGTCIDDEAASCDVFEVDPSLLENADAGTGGTVSEELHSHLLRSLCPVTDQPDFGSVLIRYRGTPIDRASLLRYLVSYRNHNDFHESSVERIFVDLKERCGPEALTVCGFFNRRGGIDINPFRSDFEETGSSWRLWRQ
ncbi:MAG TPA: NADPH-dependent 7-cyano-7-deazaguanine reductase QueF [Woeseiaceae bacterium]|nr:NADPH-dependent 7-cyano-7-deazaguanine reductase QueF [Woeseiaceae bacterium]